jgi:hypothetical protein
VPPQRPHQTLVAFCHVCVWVPHQKAPEVDEHPTGSRHHGVCVVLDESFCSGGKVVPTLCVLCLCVFCLFVWLLNRQSKISLRRYAI